MGVCVGGGDVSSATLFSTEAVVILVDEYLLIHTYSTHFYLQ